MNRRGYETDFLSEICRNYKKDELFKYSMEGNHLRRVIGNGKNFYNELKKLFYNHLNNKWQIKKTIAYVREKNLPVENFIAFLTDVRLHLVADSKGKKQYKSFLDLIENLKGNKKLNDHFKLKIQLKKETDIISFLKGFKNNVAVHLSATDRDLIRLIYNNIETNYQLSTLERLYYDSKKEE